MTAHDNMQPDQFGALTDFHKQLRTTLRKRMRDWEHGTLEDAHMSDVADTPSMSVKDLSEHLYSRGVKVPGPRDIENALDYLVKRGDAEMPVYGEWQAT